MSAKKCAFVRQIIYWFANVKALSEERDRAVCSAPLRMVATPPEWRPPREALLAVTLPMVMNVHLMAHNMVMSGKDGSGSQQRGACYEDGENGFLHEIRCSVFEERRS